MEHICVLDYTCLFKYGSGNLQVQHFVDEIMPTHFLWSFKTFIEHVQVGMTEKGYYYSSRFITKTVTTVNHFCNKIITFLVYYKNGYKCQPFCNKSVTYQEWNKICVSDWDMDRTIRTCSISSLTSIIESWQHIHSFPLFILNLYRPCSTGNDWKMTLYYKCYNHFCNKTRNVIILLQKWLAIVTIFVIKREM